MAETIKTIKLSQIKVNAENPRTITGDKFQKLVCSGTVDERAAAALEGKKGVQQGLLDSLNYLMRKYNE